MKKLYTCFKCKGAVIERNSVEFCSECGEIFNEQNKNIVLNGEIVDENPDVEVIDPSDIEVMDAEPVSEEEQLVSDMWDIVNEGAEERIQKRKEMRGFQRVEYDVENAGKAILDLLTREYPNGG